MIKQSIGIKRYWQVVVFYDIDYNLFCHVADELYAAGASGETIGNVYRNMHSGNAHAFTFSNIREHKSIVGFNKHSTSRDYLNSIVHEAEHVKQAMLYAYDVGDSGEPPAHTIGYLIERMYPIISGILFGNSKRIV